MIDDITGQTFGKLTVINFLGIEKKTHYYWRCGCDCGKIVKVDMGN